jgi:hypothetical protein
MVNEQRGGWKVEPREGDFARGLGPGPDPALGAHLRCRFGFGPKPRAGVVPAPQRWYLQTVMHLVERLFANRDRARELVTLRRRFARALADVNLDAELREQARALLELRRELSRSLGAVRACCDCVRPRSKEWPGGHCCSGSTQAIFSNEELAALRITGTRLSRFTGLREPLRGCVFRGQAGCTLRVEHRPCLCVRYTCRELEAELSARGDRAAVAKLQQRLHSAFEAFCRTLQARQAAADPFA